MFGRWVRTENRSKLFLIFVLMYKARHALLPFLIFLCVLSSLKAQTVSWNIELLGRWNDSNIPFNGKHRTYNEVWGFAKDGREYGVIGSREGTYLIDVTEPEYPNLVEFFPGAWDDATNRDYHDYAGYLYMVADQGPSTLQIVDLRSLPDTAFLVYDSDTLFQRCHNIFIDSATAHLYACSVKKGGNGSDMQMYSLDNPIEPELLIAHSAPSRYHDVYVKNDTAFANCEREGMFVFDFTDLSQIELLGSVIEYPDKGYNHSGWTTEDGHYYFFADETPGSDIKVCDVTDLENIDVVNTFNSGVNDSSMAHNLLVKGNYLYVSYYHDGVQIYEITDPANPVSVGFYDTFLADDYEGGKGCWGVYPYLPSGNILASDREKGLFILDPSEAIKFDKNDTVSTVLDIFPNPFTDRVVVSILGQQSIQVLRVFDAKGNRMLEYRPDTPFNETFTWSGMREFPAGIYFVQLIGENLTEIKKLIKAF